MKKCCSTPGTKLGWFFWLTDTKIQCRYGKMANCVSANQIQIQIELVLLVRPNTRDDTSQPWLYYYNVIIDGKDSYYCPLLPMKVPYLGKSYITRILINTDIYVDTYIGDGGKVGLGGIQGKWVYIC